MQQGDCEVTHEVFVSAATRMNNNSRVLTSKIISYHFFFRKHTHIPNKKKKNEKRWGIIGRGGGEETSSYLNKKRKKERKIVRFKRKTANVFKYIYSKAIFDYLCSVKKNIQACIRAITFSMA